MTTKDIRTSHAHTVCDVCGRTLLRGERAEVYINGGARRSVCELCKPRAINEGWVREGTLPDYNPANAGAERRRSLFNRLRSRRDSPGRGSRGRPTLDDELAGRTWEPPDAAPMGDYLLPPEPTDGAEPLSPPVPAPHPADYDPAPHPADDGEPGYWNGFDDHTEVYSVSDTFDDPAEEEFDDPEPAPPTPQPDEDPVPSRRPWSRRPRSLRPSEGAPEPPQRPSRRPARGSDRSSRRARPAPHPADAQDGRPLIREPRHVRAVPSGPEQKMAAAVDLFNQSEHRRTVAGVARSLGGASVAILPADDAPSLVHIVVCWELCWYRYAVDLSDSVPGVRVDGQGYELSELADEERVQNAVADESGQLILR